MTTVVVKRGGQITLTKNVRERLGVKAGDALTINTIGRTAVITKQDPTFWRRPVRYLPPRFEKTLEALRADTAERLRRFRVL